MLADDELALAVVRREDGAKPHIEHCETYAVGSSPGGALEDALERLRAGRLPACAVLDSDDYQIVQIEAPEVLPSEMRAAIRWRLKDAIGFDIDEAAIDVFEMPERARGVQHRMVFAVAARDSAVQRVSGVMKPVARGFDAIDIPEMCLRNVCEHLPQSVRGVAMLALHERFAQLVVTRQGVVYLTRRIDLGRGTSMNMDGTAHSVIDAASLALELQRSLDYYESHYDQAPIGDLLIAPAEDRARTLAESLKHESSLRTSLLDVREHFGVGKSGELVTSWARLMALGAALRQDTAG